ncbi:putative DNA repair protein [Apostichopus japonicus]|uniref:Putative DNA repair protein n=1 Tax=Stichopus japonicus TaxID=307972 RepID=A0A2G8KF85_STIJA|nr:putative DNA repair protein [Apostichopus japonicus]
MGVHGLWKLLAPTGKPVTLESLEGKVLAVDVSIWLNQAMYGMQGYQATRANAHLVVLFNRICKLLHYKIKPIFVFDGVAPELKKHTLNARRKRKELAEARAKRATDRIVKNYLKSHALNELSKDTQSTKGKKPSLSRMLPKSEKDASIFELPPLPEDTKQRSRTILDEKEDMYLDRIDQQEAVEAQFDDINDIDINSEEFRCLPEEIQHEVITNIRESRKKPFWSRFKELPKKADDFSSYQLSRLLKKGKMSHRLDELQKDMKTKTSGDLAVLLDYETRLQAFEAGRVASEDAQHYLLIKNKPQNDEKKESDAEEENEMEVRNFDQKRPPLEGDYKTLEVMSRMEAGDDERSRKYGDFGQAKTIADGGHHLPSSTRLAPAESAETRRKNQIRHEVLQFFREYNTSVKGQKNDNKVDSDEKVRKKRKSNLIVDEEDQRGLDKRKEDQSSTSPKKKRRHEEITVVEEVEDKLKLKEEGVKKTPKSQQQPGFLGQSDVNLSDEYDSDQEKELNDEKSRSDVVTERIIEDDCTSEDKHSEGTPVSMDVNVVADVPSIQARTLVESDTEGISVMEDEILMVEDEDGREAEEQEGKEVKEIATEGSVTGQDVTKVTEDAENSEHSGEVELLPSEEPGNDVLLIPNLEESENNATLLDESATSSKDSTFMFNQEDFNTMQEKLDLERLNLEKDRGKDQRMSASVTEAMYNETKELLNLFGIPYIESPQEAEAQCAFLDLSGQCQGIITDDSDVWLFGGQRVYKNFFTKDRDVLFYHDQAIERQLTLDRYKLINMALLMGSDYTIGIQGVGFVTALEIMSEFSGDGIEGLERFRKWWEDANNEDISATDAKIRSKLSKVILPSDFPNHVVVRAYLDPEVDKSVEKFTWNSPDLDLLRTYPFHFYHWKLIRGFIS